MIEIKFRMRLHEVRDFIYFTLNELLNDKLSTLAKCYLLDINHQPYQQYTGIEDKNDKSIYEGDIVKATFPFADSLPEIQPIVFEDAMFGVRFKNQGNCMIKLNCLDLEVLGNIYENSELLNS